MSISINKLIVNTKAAAKEQLLKSVNDHIVQSVNPHHRANGIIMTMGVGPVANENVARMVAVALTEYKYDHEEDFNVTDAIHFVNQKFEQQAATLGLGTKMIVKLKPLGRYERSLLVDLKKERAREIFNAMVGEVSFNQIVLKVAEDLKLTNGNANYYVYRCFVPTLNATA